MTPYDCLHCHVQLWGGGGSQPRGVSQQGGGPPWQRQQQWQHRWDSIRPIRHEVALGLKTNSNADYFLLTCPDTVFPEKHFIFQSFNFWHHPNKYHRCAQNLHLEVNCGHPTSRLWQYLHFPNGEAFHSLFQKRTSDSGISVQPKLIIFQAETALVRRHKIGEKSCALFSSCSTIVTNCTKMAWIGVFWKKHFAYSWQQLSQLNANCT